MLVAEKKRQVSRRYILFLSANRGKSKKLVISFNTRQKRRGANDKQLRIVCQRVYDYLRATVLASKEKYQGVKWSLKLIAKKAYPPYLQTCADATFKLVKLHLREYSKVTLQLIGLQRNGKEICGPRVRVLRKD